MAKKTSTSVILEVNRHEFAAGLRAVLLAVASNPLTHMGERLTCVVMPVCSPASDLECACRFPKKEAKAEAPKPAKKPVKVVPRKRTRKAA